MKSTISQEQINDTAVRLGIPTIPFFQRRIARAYDLVETNKVNEISHDDGLYRVHSQYDNKIYTVEVNHGNPHCTCPDGKRTVNCKHMIASMMVAQEREQWSTQASPSASRVTPAPALTVKETAHKETVKASWVVTDGNEYTNVWQDLNGKICCVCGAYYKRDCIHKQAIRDYYDGGNVSKIVNDCGTETAKALQDKLNGSNGTGDNQTPVHHQLDTSNPFQECEQLDIDQIEGRSNGDLVHVLSNGEYVISYKGIMALAEQHGMTFEASRHDETHTVIAYGRCGSNSRASGKPINGAEMTALELAKRNTARQLLPLPEIKALEHKVKLEVERGAIRLKKRKPSAPFNWQVAKRKCLEIVPDFTLDILIHDFVQADTLRQAHPSDYNRKEWLVIFDACKRDAETNGHDGDGVETHGEAARLRLCAPGDNTPSSDDEKVTCCICNRTLTNKLSISRCVGPECYKKVGAQGAQFLQDDEVSDELIEASKLYSDEVLQKRIIKSCLTLDAPLPVKVLNWLGNEYFGYKNRPILYYVCAAGQLNRIDTSNRKLRHRIITSETAETELDAHALAQMVVDVAEEYAHSSATREEPLGTMDEFVERCKQAEATVEDTIADDADTLTNGDGKRKLVMGKDKNITLVEPDGTQTSITMKDAAFTFGSNFILRLTQGIACGADISTVELDN